LGEVVADLADFPQKRASREDPPRRKRDERYKRGTARTGRSGKGGKVKSLKQAIAIDLSRTRKDARNIIPAAVRNTRRPIGETPYLPMPLVAPPPELHHFR
jgi:hypothetical protein